MPPPPAPAAPPGCHSCILIIFSWRGSPPPAPTPKPDYFTPTFPPKSVLFDSLFFSNLLRNHATVNQFFFKIIKYIEKYPKYHTPHFRQKLKKKTPTRLDPREIWDLRLAYRILNIYDEIDFVISFIHSFSISFPFLFLISVFWFSCLGSPALGHPAMLSFN